MHSEPAIPLQVAAVMAVLDLSNWNFLPGRFQLLAQAGRSSVAFTGKLAGGELEACDSNFQLPGDLCVLIVN
jgi:hypothetical protein